MSEMMFFDPDIPGLKALLPPLQASVSNEQSDGFRYYSQSGLKMVVYGPPGSGKTILALQVAFAAVIKGYTVVYFTKDTPARILYETMVGSFNCFRQEQVKLPQEKLAPWITVELTDTRDNKPSNVSIVFLGELQRTFLDGRTEEPRSSARQGDLFDNALKSGGGRFLAFANFNETPTALSRIDPYAVDSTIYQALGHFQPELKPTLDSLAQRIQPQRLFVVCDSLSPATLADHLRLQSYLRAGQSGRVTTPPAGLPAFLFVLESAELPPPMSVAFPPDVQIRLGIRPEAHRVQSRTIQLVKTRFQKSLDEEAPLAIIGYPENKSAALETPIWCDKGGNWTDSEPEIEKQSPRGFSSRRPGLEILPPLAHEADLRRGGFADGSTDEFAEKKIKFGVKAIDDLAGPAGSLFGGGCTLLVTQSRCRSTGFSLYYLLGQVAEHIADQADDEKKQKLDLSRDAFRLCKHAPKSVLYINFSHDIRQILHTIWRHPTLRSTIWNGTQPQNNPGDAWRGLTSAVLKAQQRTAVHRLYKIPLLHRGAPRDTPQPTLCNAACGGPFLYIYVPDFTWITPEEAMDRVARLLEFKSHANADQSTCYHCLEIDRVVLDRVGRLQARWPLITNTDVFVSGVAALCTRNNVEILIVDDTTQPGEAAGTFHSRWEGAAQNIWRLRPVTFHGSETITLQLVRASGRIGIPRRPFEISFRKGEVEWDERIHAEDSFRGYTGLALGKPERCQVMVELSYDDECTPLYREVYATQQSLQSTMDGVSVKIMGPREWSGINSAYANLSSVSRDTCHIVAIDAIGLSNLLQNRVLHRLTNNELQSVLPEQIGKEVVDLGENPEVSKVGEKLNALYATRAMNLAVAQIEYNSIQEPSLDQRRSITATLATLRKEQGPYYAIPMRHNWGVLAVSKLSKVYMKRVFQSLMQGDPPNREKMLDLIWRQRLRKQETTVDSEVEKNELGKVVDRVLPILFGDSPTAPPPPTSGQDDANHVATKLHKFIYGPEAVHGSDALNWRQIADFRTHTWYPFWEGDWINQVLSGGISDSGGKGPRVELLLRLFPRIDLFSIASTTEESAVSFLLELLLSEVRWDELFEYLGDVDPKMAGTGSPLIRFKDCRKQFVDALILFYRLLAPAQRRQIGIGVRVRNSEMGMSLQYQVLGGQRAANPSENVFKDWPCEISLLSREWITTVPDLMPRYDVRESVELRPLPNGNGDFMARLCTEAQLPVDVSKHLEIFGPTVAGPWYIGVLSGGNTDLGADVMREILSKQHEVERLFNRCGAPVSRELYDEVYLHGKLKLLPYGDAIRALYPLGEKSQNTLSGPAFFPFYRTQIVNYSMVSDVLYDLIKHVMRLQTESDATLISKGDPGNAYGLGADVLILVEQAFCRLCRCRAAKDSSGAADKQPAAGGSPQNENSQREQSLPSGQQAQ